MPSYTYRRYRGYRREGAMRRAIAARMRAQRMRRLTDIYWSLRYTAPLRRRY